MASAAYVLVLGLYGQILIVVGMVTGMASVGSQ